jgi:hypothetical protein
MKNKHSVRLLRYNLILLFISIIFSVVILELGLRWFTVFPVISWVDSPNLTKDEILSFTMAYNKFYGIDSDGFRNPHALKNAEIATLGDSHTFGFNVKAEDSWPYQLSSMTNKTVYNFGIGNYGIAQYYYLMDKAIKLNPKHIIAGLYLANDLNDTCLVFRKLDYWRKWAHENNVNIKDCNCPACAEDEPGGQAVEKTTISSFPGYLKSAIKKTAIVTYIDYMIWTPLKAELVYFMNKFGKMDDNLIIIDDKKQKTIFSYKRLVGVNNNMDLKKQNTRTAFEIAKKLFIEMKNKADQNNIILSVLVIPSKENVYYDYLLNRDYKLPSEFHLLVKNERNLLDEFSRFFKETGIKWTDARPYVVNALHGQDKVYKITLDNHPLAIGYQAYAKAVYEHILQ